MLTSALSQHAETQLRKALHLSTSGSLFSAEQMSDLVGLLMSIDLETSPFPQLASALLCSLKTRGESVAEIVGAASSLREHQVGVTIPTNGDVLLDTCGTGGDGAHLINISTVTALVVAALGVPVAKHGNRSVSSACGSADLLEALGYPLHSDPKLVSDCVARTGFGFLFAPHFHPALKNLAGLRRRLGVRTIFNLLGPLVNPAAVTHQLIGVFDKNLVNPLAQAASNLGTQRVLVVHGCEGLDELSPVGTTWATLAQDGRITDLEWTPKKFGAKPVPLEKLKGGDAACNAAIFWRLLDGDEPEIASAVSMNVAACLWLVERTDSLKDGYEMSLDALNSGTVTDFFSRSTEAALKL